MGEKSNDNDEESWHAGTRGKARGGIWRWRFDWGSGRQGICSRRRGGLPGWTDEIECGGSCEANRGSSGKANASVVDALDDSAVNRYIDGIVEQSGKIDVIFNATGPLAKEYGNGKNAVELPIEEFMVPMNTVVKAHFISARAAARHLIKQRSGVIIFLTGSPDRGHVPGATAIGAAFGAIETLMESLAEELSPAGVRVVCVRTTANVDSRTILDSTEGSASKMNITQGEAIARIANSNFFKVPATVQDTANAAVLIASDRAHAC